MKMRRFFTVVFAICMLFLSSCTVNHSDDEVVTGDVRQELDKVEQDTLQDEQENDVTNETQENENENNIENAVSVEGIIKELGANATLRGGDSYESAVKFCEALKNGDTVAIVDFTEGKREYYDFVSDINIKSYTLHPFVLGEEARKQAEQEGLYVVGTDMYIAEFDVENADGEYFQNGLNYYYLEFSYSDYMMDECVSAFVPAKDAEAVMYDSVYSDNVEYFINQFISHMGGDEHLEDGKNNADSFDFDSPSGVHMITHLMAHLGNEAKAPPYTMSEIEEFIKTTFDGHRGQVVDNVMSFQRWIYPLLDEKKTTFTKEDRAYGCSYAHGGTASEYTILEILEDGNMFTYEVQLYADFSNFAKAKKLTFLFEQKEDGQITLLGIVQSDNKYREVAALSF